MLCALAAVEAAFAHADPDHSIPFWTFVPYLLDPAPEFTVRIETPAGIHKTTITTLTPDHTVRHLQCAYQADCLVTYLAEQHISIPPTVCQRIADVLYEHGYISPDFIWTAIFGDTAHRIREAMERGPTEFSDTFAIQLQTSLDQHILIGNTSLKDAGLVSNVTLTLVVTIRPDRANFEVAQTSADRRKLYRVLEQRYKILGGDIRCRMPTSPTINRALVLTAYREHGHHTILAYAPTKFQDDREIVLAAVQCNGGNLRFAPTKFQDDREIVLAAVGDFGRALQYASMRLQDEFDVVQCAVHIDSMALMYASKRLQAVFGGFNLYAPK